MADRKAENIAISGRPQKTIMEFETPKKPKTNKYALGCALLASMTTVLLGYGQYIYIYIYIHVPIISIHWYLVNYEQFVCSWKFYYIPKHW